MTLVVWALPCVEDGAAYAAVIAQLSKAQGAPAVEPHITLGSFAGDVPDLSDVLSVLKRDVLTPKNIGATDVFTRALFVRFEAAGAILEARRLMEAKAGFRSGRPFDPHISLCYGAPPPGEAPERLASSLLKQTIRIDRLAVMSLVLPFDSYTKIEAREIVRVFD